MSIFPPLHAATSESRDIDWATVSLTEFFEHAQAEVEAGRAWPDDAVVLTTVEAAPLAGVDEPVEEAAASDAYGPGPPETDGLIYARHALTYFGLGYSPLPLPPRTKKSPPPGFTGASAPMATEDEVRDWCVERPDANIALRLPDTVIAIDVDATDGKTGVETMRAAAAKLGKLPPLGRSTASTETKGHGHYLFRVPAGTRLVENLNHLFGAHVDLIQHTHRYIVAPPSIHPNGHAYEWESTEHSKFPAVDQLPELPATWLAALRRAERDADDAGVRGGDRTEYETFSDSIRAEVDAHTSTEIERTLAKLETLKTLPDGARGEDGRGWHDGIRDYTKYLARLCCAPWSPIMPEDLIPRLKENLPFDHRKPLLEGLNMFAAAVESGDGADRPAEIGAAMLMEAVGEREPVAPELSPAPTCVDRVTGDHWPQLEAAHGELAQADDLLDHIADAVKPRLRRRSDTGLWLVWQGNRWSADYGDATVASVVGGLLRAQPVHSELKPTQSGRAAEARTFFSQEIGRTRALAPKTLAARLSTRRVLWTSAQFDAEPWLINTPGGLLDLTSGDVTPHDPSMLVTGISRVSYRPGAAHHDVDYLMSLHEPDVVAYLQMVCGLALTGIADARISLILGPGGNGKTTLLGSLAAAMGTYGFAGTGRDLADVISNIGHKMVSVFEGKRLVLFEELPRSGRLDAAGLKRVVGGGKQGGDAKYQPYREWDPTASVIVNANEMPRTSEFDRAIKRRLRVVPLTGSIPELQQDPSVENRLRTDPKALEAIFAWAVEGAIRVHREFSGALPSPTEYGGAVVEYTDRWADSLDTAGQFFAECLEEADDPNQWVLKADIYERFEQWWTELKGRNERPPSPEQLYADLAEHHGVEIPRGKEARSAAKRKVTNRLIGLYVGKPHRVLELGSTVAPVRGWRVADLGQTRTLTPADLLGAN